MSTADRRFETRLDIAAPRDAVWRALTEVAELRRWFPPEATVEPGVGGRVEWRWPDMHTWSQTIEVWEEGRRLRTRYMAQAADGGADERPLFVEFVLEGEGGSTTLRLVHSGFDRDASFDAEYDGISHGWPVELEALRLYLERHRGEERALVWSRRPCGADADAAWEQLAGPDGLDLGAGADRLARGDRLRVPVGDVEGEVLVAQPRELVARATSHGDGFLRIGVETYGGAPTAWVWLATWGRPAAETRALQARWDALLERLFVEDPTAARP